MSTPEDLARWLKEGRELLRMLNEQVEYLAQENERLRAELGRLDEPRAVITRVNQDNDRLRAEQDELLAEFRRVADLVEQVRHSRGGGGVSDGRAKSRDVQPHAVGCHDGRGRRALDRGRAAAAHSGALAVVGGDRDRLGPADAALLAVLLDSCRACACYHSGAMVPPIWLV